jgi:hypothetical protein
MYFGEPRRLGSDARAGQGSHLDGRLERLADRAVPVKVGPGELHA